MIALCCCRCGLRVLCCVDWLLMFIVCCTGIAFVVRCCWFVVAVGVCWCWRWVLLSAGDHVVCPSLLILKFRVWASGFAAQVSGFRLWRLAFES